jgi:hypothetical protein
MRGVSVAVAGTALALLAGGVVSTAAVLRPQPHGAYAVGEAVPTSLGTVRVTGVERMGGLTAQDLSSANHGVANLVSEGQAQVQVTLRVTNDTERTLRYSPGQLGLRVGTLKPVRAMTSTLPKSQLKAGTSLEGTVGFVATRNGSALALELPGQDGPVLVDLGRTDTASGVDAGPADSTSHQH